MNSSAPAIVAAWTISSRLASGLVAPMFSRIGRSRRGRVAMLNGEIFYTLRFEQFLRALSLILCRALLAPRLIQPGASKLSSRPTT
jgi:hypothetical protein